MGSIMGSQNIMGVTLVSTTNQPRFSSLDAHKCLSLIEGLVSFLYDGIEKTDQTKSDTKVKTAFQIVI
jgi:hypothetical protein